MPVIMSLDSAKSSFSRTSSENPKEKAPLFCRKAGSSGLFVVYLDKKSMANFDYIGDVLVQADGTNIVKKKSSPLKGVLLLAVGGVILYLATAVTTEKDMLSSLLILLGICVLVWSVTVFIASKERFIYQPTKQVLKKHVIYVSPNQSFKLHQIIQEGKYEELKNICQSGQSNLSLVIYSTDDKKYAALQAQEFIPYNDVPTTPVRICRPEQVPHLAALY